MNLTPVFYRNLESDKRTKVNQGGTSSSKTWSILQLLYLKALHADGLLISVVAETLPHLKRGAMRDFFKMLKEEGQYIEANHNKSDNIYHVGSSAIEFFSADNAQKVQGPRRDILFINECYRVNYNTYLELEVRTKAEVYLDYNPRARFWVHDKVLPDSDNVEYIHSTYRDNNRLPPSIVEAIERKREANPNWWRVFGEGEIGNVEGLIYTNWEVVKEFPTEVDDNGKVHQLVKPLGMGLDFGFTNDPTALVTVGEHAGELWVDCPIYATGLTNDNLLALAKSHELDLSQITIADSAEPKTIEDLRIKGWRNIVGATKGKDSVTFGIAQLQERKLNVTQRSVDLIAELRAYEWLEDRDGNYGKKPAPSADHALDALRYCVTDTIAQKGKRKVLSYGVIGGR